MVIDGVFSNPLPCTGSHEGSGVVVAVGSKVNEASRFHVGDRVMSALARNPCGRCIHCRRPDDWQQYCFDDGGKLGINRDGAFAEYHVVDCRMASHLPSNVSFQTASPLACAGVTIFRAILVSGLKAGDWLGLVGAGGGLGHLGIQFARARDLNVVAVDARDEGLELCRKYQAHEVLDAREGQKKVVERTQQVTDGLGVDATINVSDHATAAALSCAITRPHGTVVQVAQPENVSVPFAEIIVRDITIKGTMYGGVEDSRQMLDEASRHGVQAETVAFQGLQEVPKLLDFASSGRLKGKAICIVDGELV